jgi:hypothetical protein
MAAFNKIQAFVEHVAEKVHNLGADTLKYLLTNTAPVNTNTVKADLTEITAQNGYTAGGSAPTISTSAQTGGTYKLVLADLVFTGTGGTFGPFRYPTLYNDTPASPADPLIGWYDYASSISVADTETFTVDHDPTTGVLQIA